MTRILAFAGTKQAGKTTAANFIAFDSFWLVQTRN